MNDIVLSVSLFCHHTRLNKAQETIGRLKTTSNKDVSIKLIVDENNEGIWKTAMRAWSAFDSNSTHHMVLQDDILVCNDFMEIAPTLISLIPSWDSLSFCDNVHLMDVADENDLHWVRSNALRHAQALVQPVEQIIEWIDWAEWNIRPEYYHDDGRLEAYLIKHNKYIWHTVPSLVEHNDNGSVNRMIKTGLEGKKGGKDPYTSYRFIGENSNGADINWQRGLWPPVTYRRANLGFVEKWALGESTPEIDDPDALNHPIINSESLSIPYDVAIKDARIERCLT